MKQTETGGKKEIYPAAGVHSSVSVAFDVIVVFVWLLMSEIQGGLQVCGHKQSKAQLK